MEIEEPHIEIQLSSEFQPFQYDLHALDARLLLGHNALNPDNNNLQPLQLTQIMDIDHRDYSAFINTSSYERREYWQQRNNNFESQKNQWIESTTEKFKVGSAFFKSNHGLAWSQALEKIGINASNFTAENAQELFNKYCSSTQENSNLKTFVKDILNAYRKPDGTVDYSALNGNLDTYQWISGIFGKKSSQIIAHLINSEAQLASTQEIKQTFIENNNSTVDSNLRLNRISAQEDTLLRFVWNHKNREAPEVQHVDYSGDFLTLHDGKYEFSTQSPEVTQIREIVSQSEVIKQGLPVYYLGARGDIIKPLSLTDAENFIFLDFDYIKADGSINPDALPDEYLTTIGAKHIQIIEDGILGQGGKRILKFDWGGKKRTVTMYAEDATKFIPQELKNGSAFTYIYAPTPMARIDGDTAPSLIHVPETLNACLKNTALNGFIHYHALDLIPPQCIGLQKLVNGNEKNEQYRDPLYKKIKEEPESLPLLQMDRDLFWNLQLRDGTYTGHIGDITLVHYEQELQKTRLIFDSLSPQKRQELIPFLKSVLIAQEVDENTLQELLAIGRKDHIDTESQLRAYLARSNEIVLNIFSELKSSIEQRVTPEIVNKIKAEMANNSRHFVSKIRDPRDYVPTENNTYEHISFGHKIFPPLGVVNFVGNVIEKGWFSSTPESLSHFSDRYQLPMAIFTEHPWTENSHAVLVLSNPYKDSHLNWKLKVWDPGRQGERIIDLNRNGHSLDIDSLPYLYTNDLAKNMLKDNTYEISITHNESFSRIPQEVKDRLLPNLQYNTPDCLPFCYFMGATLHALKPGSSEFKIRLAQFNRDYTTQLKTIEEILH